MLYFAYGSNMEWTQMKQRCSSARFLGVAMLPDHRLAVTRKSKWRNCGVVDMVREAACEVWGVVFEIADSDIKALDKSEGYRPGRDENSYWRRECMVFIDGDDSRPLMTASYFAEPVPDPPPPNQAYKDLILAGARRWHLPEVYIRQLESIPVDG